MIESLRDLGSELIVLGDFNSRWYEQRSNVRDLADNLDLSTWNPSESGLGTYKSAEGKRLDWILVSRQLEFVDYSVVPDIVADHLLVSATVRYRGE